MVACYRLSAVSTILRYLRAIFLDLIYYALKNGRTDIP